MEARLYTYNYISSFNNQKLQEAFKIIDDIRVNNPGNAPYADQLTQYQKILQQLETIGRSQSHYDTSIPPLGQQVTLLFDQLMAHANAQAEEAQATSNLLVLLFSIFALVLALLIAISITRYITTRLLRIVEVAQNVTATPVKWPNNWTILFPKLITACTWFKKLPPPVRSS